MVTWGSNHGSNIYGQIFKNDGSKEGNQFQINTYTSQQPDWNPFEKYAPSMAALANGGFVVTWNNYWQDGDGSGIYARIYDNSPSTGLLSLDLLDTNWSNDSDNIYRATGRATLGLLSGNSSMLYIQDAQYTLTGNALIIEGEFSAIIEGTTRSLFIGKAVFDVTTGFAELTVGSNLHNPAGLGFEFTALDLSNNYIDIHFSPLELPAGISNTNIILGSDSFVIKENYPQLGFYGSVNFPDKTFELFDMLTVHAYDWSVSYDSPDNELHILGGFELQTGWDNVPGINAELTGDGLVIRNGEFADVALTITLDDFSVKGWGFNNVSVTLDTEKNSIVGSAGIKLPMFASSLETTIGFIVNPFELDTALFHIPFINPGIALGTTGWFLTAIEGGVSNLASSNKEPLLFKGGVELQLPEVMDLSVNGELDSKHIAGFVEGTIIDKDAIDFQGQVTLNWNKDYVRVNGSASFAQGMIVGDFGFTSNLNLDFTAKGSATVKFDTIDQILSGHYYLNYSNDHKDSNDYIAAWAETVLHIPVFGDKTVTIGTKYSFDGTWRAFGAAEVPLYSSWIVDETISDLMVTVNWDNPVNDVETRVVVYDDLEKTKIRQIISEAEYGEHDIAIISEWSGSTAKVIYINTPEAGLWDVEVINSDGLGEVVYSATTSLKPLVLTVGELNLNNDQLSLSYIANTPETDGVISFYLDDNDNGFDGQMIESMADPDGNGQWVWNTTGFHGGTYWLYATLADGKSAPVMSYAAQSIFINNAPVALDDSIITNEDTAVVIDVLVNDSDFDDNPLRISSITTPSNGTVSVTDDNKILFAPYADTYGESIFTYTITDGYGGESTAVVNITINSMPDAPKGSVIIEGHLKQGEILRADVSTLSDSDGMGTIAYQWKVDGTNIEGATNETYTLTAAEVGNIVTVEVSYTDGNGKLESVASLATNAVTPINAPNHHDLDGTITFWQTGDALADVATTLTQPNNGAATATTDVHGYYQIPDVQSGTYQLSAIKATDTATTNAVTTDDVHAVLKIAAGINPNPDGSAVSPYQFLAADINHDGKVRAADALLLLKMIVDYEGAPEPQWYFAPYNIGNEATMDRSHVDWSVTNPQTVTINDNTTVNLIGILTGDVV
uniref:Dockerin domain-containing protein n=1 Tax=Chlorobium chlorochromatii (strain CaD3) TaxID=340177 RepID=Q3ARR5_CHLCH